MVSYIMGHPVLWKFQLLIINKEIPTREFEKHMSLFFGYTH